MPATHAEGSGESSHCLRRKAWHCRFTPVEWAQRSLPPANQGSETPPEHREQSLRDRVRSQESQGARGHTTALWTPWKIAGSRSPWVIWLCSRPQPCEDFSLISDCILVLSMGCGTLTWNWGWQDLSRKYSGLPCQPGWFLNYCGCWGCVFLSPLLRVWTLPHQPFWSLNIAYWKYGLSEGLQRQWRLIIMLKFNNTTRRMFFLKKRLWLWTSS